MRPSIAIAVVPLVVAFWMPGGAAAQADELTAPSAADVQAWGEETLGTIRQDFWREQPGLYVEQVGARQRGRGDRPAYMWSAGVQLSALAVAARLDPERYTGQLTEYAAALKAYWHEHNGVGGYDVQPRSANADR